MTGVRHMACRSMCIARSRVRATIGAMTQAVSQPSSTNSIFTPIGTEGPLFTYVGLQARFPESYFGLSSQSSRADVGGGR